MLILGLTGSIGMGKSATAAMFREAGVPVFDADHAVHILYSGEAAPLVEQAFPGTLRDGMVDRALLSKRVVGDLAALARLEGIVHPLVRRARETFLAEARRAGCALVVFDIPLLFETDSADEVDAVVVVSAPPELQRERVLARPDMSEEKLASILARQVPDADKRARAHFVVDTSLGFDYARREVAAILRALAPAATARGGRRPDTEKGDG